MCQSCTDDAENKPFISLIAPELSINTKGLTMQYTESMYQEGDVFWTFMPIDEPHCWLPCWWRELPALDDKSKQDDFDLHLLRAWHYSYMGAELNLLSTEYTSIMDLGVEPGVWRDLISPISSRLRTKIYAANQYQDGCTVEKAMHLVQEHTQVQPHPKAIAKLTEILELECSGNGVSRGDLKMGYSTAVSETLLHLHCYYANRGAIWVGCGFKGGNPMVVLAKSVFKDGVLQGWVLQEQRVGKFLQTLGGACIDSRQAIDDLKVMNKRPQMHLCYTEQEWHDAYQAGPSSCMTGFSFNVSPVRVYATGAHGLPDNNLRLCINYVGTLFGDDFEVLNRAIVNVESNTYVRAYGENGDAVMRALGYERDTGATDGCILRKIERPGGGWLMPYLDGSDDMVDDCGDYWTITRSGDYSATDPDGYILGDCRTCDCCDVAVDEDELEAVDNGDACVCGNCLEEHYTVPVGRGEYYRKNDCTWSDYHTEYVHDSDLAECAIAGVIHEDVETYDAQGYTVIEVYAEYHNGRYILTEEACDILGEDYQGYDADEEDAEEAA